MTILGHSKRIVLWAVKRLMEQSALLKDSRGALLIESVIAVGVFVGVVTITLVGVSTANRAAQIVERHGETEVVARNQMEYMFSQTYVPYPTPYAVTTTPPGFTAAFTTQAVQGFSSDAEIQKVILNVTFSGTPVVTLETIRANEATEDQ